MIWTVLAGANTGDYALYLAAGAGDIDQVRKLLNQGVNPNAAVDSSGVPALMQAAIGDTEIVKLLLNKGANINAIARVLGVTALINAAAMGDVDLVKVLTDKGADVHTKDSDGLTPLSHAKVAKIRRHSRVLETTWGRREARDDQRSDSR